ncbi:MAG: transposase [Treponema sp.]|nr:transposase [Treponema sp.]
MSKRKRYTAEEKIKVLRELQENGKTISQVSEEYGVHPNNVFKWRKQHLEMGVDGFKTGRKDISSKAQERKVAALEDKIKHKDEVISELAAELLSLKKELWPFVGKMKMSLAVRQTIETEILRYKAKTGLLLETLLRYAGISQRTWREWSARRALKQSTTAISRNIIFLRRRKYRPSSLSARKTNRRATRCSVLLMLNLPFLRQANKVC